MRKPLLLLGASLAATLLLVEGAVRLRQWQRYGTTINSFYHPELDPGSGLMIPKPLESVGQIHINSLGFRGAEIERPKPAGRLRVAFLGGSTTFCAEASSLEATWPHLVVEGLKRAAADVEFDYVNGGAAGFATPQSLLNLEHRVKPLAPDVIVLYEATNDLTHESRRLAIERGLYEMEESDHSPLGDWWLTYYLVEKNVRQFLRSRAHSEGGLAWDPVLAERYRERLTELVQRSLAVTPVVALVTFSTKLRADQSPEVQRRNAGTALFYMPFFDVPELLQGYAEYNRVIREVARASGAILIEGEDSIPGDDQHFADTVHFSDPGLVLQAERVLKGLLESTPYRALLAHFRDDSSR